MGKGIGKALMKRIEEIGKEMDCHYIIFVSSMKRKESHRFYESLGYDLDMVQGFKKYI
jgi:GNAT superfamily N-acetyltransferase